MAKLKKQTLKALYSEKVKAPVAIRNRVLEALSLKTQQSFYDILSGVRILNDAEKKEIASIFCVEMESIRWPDKNLAAE